jgi:hypothetical protein
MGFELNFKSEEDSRGERSGTVYLRRFLKTHPTVTKDSKKIQSTTKVLLT